MRSTAQIISALGGRDGVAALTGAKPRTVEQWLRIGVPHKHFGLFVETARTRGFRGISHEALYAAKAQTVREHTPATGPRWRRARRCPGHKAAAVGAAE